MSVFMSLTPNKNTKLYEDFQALLDQNAQSKAPQVGEVIEGKVVAVSKGEALVDYGGKAEGVIQGRELVDSSVADSVKVGDVILAIVLQSEDEEGRAILSIRRARGEKKWREMNNKFENKTPVKVSVVQPNKGGIIVNAEGIQGFVPISQLGPKHYPNNIQKGPGFADAAIAYLTQFIGEEFDTQIIEFERETNRLILSERVLLQRTKGFEPLKDLDFKVGDIVEGKVVAIKDFGVFVDLGSSSGLVHISEMSWDRVNHPGDIVKLDDTVKVKVIGIDEGGRRVSLSLKKLSSNPWADIAGKYKEGSVIEALVTKIVDYGAFVQIEQGFDGLVHISELSSLHIKDPADVLQEGQKAKFKIILLDLDNQRLGLSYRQANETEEEIRAAEERKAAEKAALGEDTKSPVKEKPVETFSKEEPSKAPVEPVKEAKVEVDREGSIKALTSIDGVGGVVATKLFEAGFHSVEEVAKSSQTELSLIPGIRLASAEKIIESAKKAL